MTQAGTLTGDELKEWINRHVSAKFQRVHHVIIMEEFPRNIAGKILKRVMREEFVTKI